MGPHANSRVHCHPRLTASADGGISKGNGARAKSHRALLAQGERHLGVRRSKPHAAARVREYRRTLAAPTALFRERHSRSPPGPAVPESPASDHRTRRHRWGGEGWLALRAPGGMAAADTPRAPLMRAAFSTWRFVLRPGSTSGPQWARGSALARCRHARPFITSVMRFPRCPVILDVRSVVEPAAAHGSRCVHPVAHLVS